MRRAICVAVAVVGLFPLRAHASHEVVAEFYGVLSMSDDYSKVTVVLVCEARAARVTSTTAVGCVIDDGAPGPGVSSYCSSPGPEAICHVSLDGGALPVRVCVTAYATLSDQTTDTDSHCRTYTAPTR